MKSKRKFFSALSLILVGMIYSESKAKVVGVPTASTDLKLAPPKVQERQNLDRNILPIPDEARIKTKTVDIRDVKKLSPIVSDVEAPKGAPNVLVILLDDFGYGHSTTYGGPIQMPTLDALAKEGLQYTQFHTASLSSPTRTALLTGRNHHMNNMGSITESSTSEAGNTSKRVNQITALPRILRENGYNTSMFGKFHEVPAWETNIQANQKLWPLNIGFNKFYGFLGGESDQFQPVLLDGNVIVPTPRDVKDYSLTTDLTDKAIQWITMQNDLYPNQPFFTYFAPGAVHAPHQVPEEWINKYKGKFDKGWDEVRKETFEKQKAKGIIPKDAVLTPKPAEIKDWDKLTPTEQKVFTRQMEIFAAFAEYADTEVGRIIQALKDNGQYDNTMIVYIAGDNGASGEGGQNGLLSEVSYFNGQVETIENMEKNLDKLGTRDSANHYAMGWAVAGDTPFKWTKQIGSDFGGTRNGMVISWPAGIKMKGELRNQWSYVTDIAPTILEAAKLPEPKKVDGITQIPIQGASLISTFGNKNEPTKHTTQYFEMFGNRAIYKDGWFLRTIHKSPSGQVFNTLANDVWELYDTTKDFTLSNDVSKKYPEKVKELYKEFEKEAINNYVYPIDDRTIERASAEIAGRPSVMNGRTSLKLHEGATHLPTDSFIDVKNKSSQITAKVNIKDSKKTDGVIIAQGGHVAGWTLYTENGIVYYEYNFLKKLTSVKSNKPLKNGENAIRVDFKYNENNEGGAGAIPKAGLGKGGNIYLYINDELVGKSKIDETIPLTFGIDYDSAGVGMDDGSTVSYKYADRAPFKFTQKIKEVKVEVFPGK
ncbi:MAG: arylsulfatase [Fusobacteriaceae bacterium]